MWGDSVVADSFLVVSAIVITATIAEGRRGPARDENPFYPPLQKNYSTLRNAGLFSFRPPCSYLELRHML